VIFAPTLLGTSKRPNVQDRPEIRLRAGGGHRLRLPKRLPGILKLFACSWMGWPCGDPASSRGRCRLAVSARGLISALNFCRRSHRPISVICEARFVSSPRLAAPRLNPISHFFSPSFGLPKLNIPDALHWNEDTDLLCAVFTKPYASRPPSPSASPIIFGRLASFWTPRSQCSRLTR
jgi:hypothetical protein